MESERLRNSPLGASHDLRTPLAALVGLAESLAMTTPAPSGTQLETMQAIADEARRMNALVNNLLDMARIQSGEVKPRRQWLPFEEMVGSALKSAQSALGRHRVEVELDLDLPLVELDPTLIERVLYNILENAGKYTLDGTLVRLLPKCRHGLSWVAISDGGPEARRVSTSKNSSGRASRQPRRRLGLRSSRDRRSASRKDLGREQLRRRRFASRCRWALPRPRPRRRRRASAQRSQVDYR
jgi:K+-sensing histidine kinase KdpD